MSGMEMLYCLVNLDGNRVAGAFTKNDPKAQTVPEGCLLMVDREAMAIRHRTRVRSLLTVIEGLDPSLFDPEQVNALRAEVN